MDSHQVNVIQFFTDSNKKLNELLKRCADGAITFEAFSEKYNNSMAEIVSQAILNESKDKERVVGEFGNFYSAWVDKIYEELHKLPAAQTDTFLAVQNTVSFGYVFSAYLLKSKQIDSAEAVLKQKSRHLMPSHYLSRAVLTISSRNGQTSAMKGWYIGISLNIFEKYSDISSFFYDRREDFTDYLCQVDFLQFLLEYLREGEITAGYPNFVLFEKKRVDPILEALNAKYGKDKVDEVVQFATNLDSGSFFMNNRWN